RGARGHRPGSMRRRRRRGWRYRRRCRARPSGRATRWRAPGTRTRPWARRRGSRRPKGPRGPPRVRDAPMDGGGALAVTLEVAMLELDPGAVGPIGDEPHLELARMGRVRV